MLAKYVFMFLMGIPLLYASPSVGPEERESLAEVAAAFSSNSKLPGECRILKVETTPYFVEVKIKTPESEWGYRFESPGSKYLINGTEYAHEVFQRNFMYKGKRTTKELFFNTDLKGKVSHMFGFVKDAGGALSRFECRSGASVE